MGLLMALLGVTNKLWHVLPWNLPNLIIYGLLLMLFAIFFMVAALLSVQLQAIYHHQVLLQSELQRRSRPPVTHETRAEIPCA
jgi:hypothetical protein